VGKSQRKFALALEKMGAISLAGGSMVFVLLVPGVVFLSQVIVWLETGVMPVRNLFWAIADTGCQKTGWVSKGWEGMDICRNTYFQFTDAIGLNKILNSIFDVNVAVHSIFLGIICLVLMALWIGYMEMWLESLD
jgi:hypothetical protein